jgi:hypothetical protein
VAVKAEPKQKEEIIMKTRNSLISDAIVYISDDGKCQSLVRGVIEEYEFRGINKQYFFDNRKKVNDWILLGVICTPLEIFLHDKSRVYNELENFKKTKKKGNYNPLKVDKQTSTHERKLWVERGYEEKNYFCSID